MRVLLFLLLALLVPTSSLACEVEAAARQLRLAEAEVDAGELERAAASAASALRLDPACTQALFVRGLALHRAGHADEAEALLLTYRDLRGSLPLDDRFELAIGLIETAGEPLDVARALRLADMAGGGFDYDCDGEETMELVDGFVCGPCGPTVLGWRDGTSPGAPMPCGVTGVYGAYCNTVGCGLYDSSSPWTQACR